MSGPDGELAVASAARISAEQIELVIVPMRAAGEPRRYLLGSVAAMSLRLLLDDALTAAPENIVGPSDPESIV